MLSDGIELMLSAVGIDFSVPLTDRVSFETFANIESEVERYASRSGSGSLKRFSFIADLH